MGIPRGVWWWVHVSLTTCVRLGVVAAAFVLAYVQWGSWVAAIASLALLTVVGPAAIMLVCIRCLGLSDGQWREFITRLYRVRLVAALCLLVASLTTGLVWLVIACALCAAWAGLSCAVVKMMMPPSEPSA